MSNRIRLDPPDKSSMHGYKPNVRFPEFQDMPAWGQMRLFDVCSKISPGGTPDTSNTDYWNGSIEWLTPAEMGKTETRFISSTDRKITNIGLQNCSSDLLPINSVIISTRAPIGYLAINKSEMAFNQGCRGLIPGESTSHDFLYYSLLKCKTSLIDLGAGNTFKELAGNSLKHFEIPFPDIDEQQKIADCLSSIDEIITVQSQKLDTLKAHKKGLMQQLFPAEGETVPELRFPKFRDAPEWEERTIDKVANYENGKAHEKNISETGKYIVVNSKFISTEGDVRKFTNKSFCLANKEDILMVLSDVPNGKAIAKCYFVESDDLYTVNQRICKLKSKKIISKLLFYILDRNPFFLAFDDGVKQTNLRKDDVLGCPVLLPSSPDEQKKIADCLSYVDELIAAQIQKLDTFKSHKKGLMQQLFPSTDEVNG